MITADYHVHSNFSSDSKTPMELMIERAIKLGLKKLCFTDHMDYDYPPTSDYTFVFEIEQYKEKIHELKEKYQSTIDILTGIELGLQPHLSEKLAELVKSQSFDFIIGSSHLVDRDDPYYPEHWHNKRFEDVVRRYFTSIIENCKAFHGFHVYGHLDYIIRYVPKTDSIKKVTYSYADYSDVLDEVLHTIIYYGKGIEVNTSGYKYGLGVPHPNIEVIKRYKELGGEIITLGSDAHKPEHLCYEFHRAGELLKSIGYRYYATFVHGKPIYERL